VSEACFGPKPRRPRLSGTEAGLASLAPPSSDSTHDFTTTFSRSQLAGSIYQVLIATYSRE